jgi:hypothetical protein
MKKNKLNQYESKTALEPSPEQIQQAKEWAVNRIMETVDKLPANPAPVKESFAELARQAKFGVPRQPVIVQTDDFSKTTPAKTTLIISNASEVTQTDSGKNTFTDEELRILESLRNGE